MHRNGPDRPARRAQIRAAGVPVAGALSPQRTQEYHEAVLEAGVDLFVIRGTTVSAEHVSTDAEPLNLKKFIYDLDVPRFMRGIFNYTKHIFELFIIVKIPSLYSLLDRIQHGKTIDLVDKPLAYMV